MSDNLERADFAWWKRRTYPQLGELLPTEHGNVWFHDDGRDGDPVLLLGGFTGGHYCWDLVRDKLVGYRTITWEPRGLGHSDFTHGPYGAVEWSNDLRAVVDRLGLTEVQIWASGFGNYIAFEFAAEYPTLVKSVVACTDVWHGDPTKAYGRIWPIYRAIVANFGITGTGSKMLAGLFPVAGIPWFNEWEAANIEDVLHLETIEETVGWGLTRADVRARLTSVSARVMVLQADRDYLARPIEPLAEPSLRLMCDRLPSIEVQVVPNSHPGYLFTHLPDTCAELVGRFFAATAH